MAATVHTAGYCELAGQDVTSQVDNVTLDFGTEEVDVTNLGSGALRERLAGIGDFTMTWNLKKPDADLSAAASIPGLLRTGSKHASGTGIYAVKAKVGASGSTGTTANPKFEMNATCPSFNVGGDLGAVVAGGSVTFNLANTFNINTSS